MRVSAAGTIPVELQREGLLTGKPSEAMREFGNKLFVSGIHDAKGPADVAEFQHFDIRARMTKGGQFKTVTIVALVALVWMATKVGAAQCGNPGFADGRADVSGCLSKPSILRSKRHGSVSL